MKTADQKSKDNFENLFIIRFVAGHNSNSTVSTSSFLFEHRPLFTLNFNNCGVLIQCKKTNIFLLIRYFFNLEC